MKELMLVWLFATAAGCAALGTDSIAEMQAHPDRFEGRTVTVGGEVLHQLALPVIDYGAYYLRDRAGNSILILTADRLPGLHRQLRVRARVHHGTLMGNSLGIYLSEFSRF